MRPDVSIERLRSLAPVLDGGIAVTAGNSCQLSDGASACLLMSVSEASRRKLKPLELFRGFAVAGCEPEEMGIGPIKAVPKLLNRHGLKVSDIELWELNEALACQAIYCRDVLGIPQERLNVNGGAIALGHPYGMTGARLLAIFCSRALAAAPVSRSSPCALVVVWVRLSLRDLELSRSMEEQHFVRTDRRGPILLITMDRPKVNAINHAMSRALLFVPIKNCRRVPSSWWQFCAARMSGSFRLVGI